MSNNLLDYINYAEPFNFHEDAVSLARRMEFLELSSTIPSGFRPKYVNEDYDPVFLHQPVALRLALETNKLLVLYPPGSGKTCTAVAIPEYLRKYGSISGRGSSINRTYILQKSPSVIEDIKNQIIKVCAKEIYDFEESDSNKGNKRRITNTLSSFYTIQTYNTFTSVNLDDTSIEETYSDSCFIIDEAHNIVGWNREDQTYDEHGMTYQEINNNYRYLHRVLHVAKRCKVIVMTATPMINETQEFAKLLNLLLPLEEQIVLTGPRAVNFNTIDREEFNRYSRGLISYVPNRQSSVVIREIGESLPDSNLILTRVEMIGTQRKTYHRVVRQALDDVKLTFSALEHRKVSDFVYPDGSYDGNLGHTTYGLYKYVNKTEIDKYVPNPTFLEQIRTKLPELSAKFNYVIQKELKPNRTIELAPGVQFTLPGRGCSYYFFDLVTAHAIPFTMCLEAFGFERYNDSYSPFTRVNGKEVLNLEKKPRYIFITKDNVNSSLQNFKKLFNSEENVFGEYVQIIIGTRIIKDGINIFNVARIYIDPLWNPSNEEQALARAKRLPGHRALIKKSKELMLAANIDPNLVDNWKFEIEQHKMCAWAQPEPGIPKTPMHAKWSISSSIDQHMYIDIIEEKIKHISRIMNMAIDNSIDKYINTLPPPFPIEQSQINYKTYDAVYSSRMIEEIKSKIIEIFGIELAKREDDDECITNYLVYSDLSQMIFKNISPLLRRDVYIFQALTEIIKTKPIIRDRFNTKCWIHVKDNYIFISKSYPSAQSDLLDSYYSNIITSEPKSIRQVVVNYCLSNINELNQIIFSRDDSTPAPRSLTTTILIEFVIAHLYRSTPGGKDKSWWNKSNELIPRELRRLLNNHVFVFWKPYQDLKQTSFLLSLPSLNKGVKASEDSKTKLKTMVYHNDPATSKDKDVTLPLVVINTLSNNIRIMENLDHYSDSTFGGKIPWRRVLPYEEPVYKHLIEVRKRETTDNLPVGKLYGIVQLNGNFVVGRKELDDKLDKRLVAKGKVCSSVKKDELISMLEEEGVTEQQISLHYQKTIDEINKAQLCSLLQLRLEDVDRLIRI